MTETILDRILTTKKEEVTALKRLGLNFKEHVPKQTNRSLYQQFLNSQSLSIIAEIKRASPSKGNINVEMNPVQQARQYELSGANAISVLTDEHYFKGSMDDLADIRQSVDLPILCKDFIIDEIQIDRAKRAGANVILLIAAALPFDRLKELYEYATLNHLEVLFEVHNETELKVALELNVNIIGINNRNLKTFEVDLAITEMLAKQITSPNTVIISESGIKTPEDAERVANAGAHGILVGETLMTSKNIPSTIKNLQIKLARI